MSATPAPATRVRPRRRWLLFPIVLLTLFLLAIGWAYHRGTSAEETARNPASANEPVSQLYRTADGHTTVRAAMLLDHPREKVWEVVTDFANYDRFLPYLKGVTVSPGEGGDLVAGEAKSAFGGYWDFRLTAKRDRSGGAWTVRWDERGDGQVRVNRGGWTLEEPEPGRTLLALDLEAEVQGTQTWVLRNFFLYRLRQVMQAVKARLEEKGSEP